MGSMHDDDEGTYFEEDQPLEHVRAVISRPPDGFTDGVIESDIGPHGPAGQTVYWVPGGLAPVDLLPSFDSTPIGTQLVAS